MLTSVFRMSIIKTSTTSIKFAILNLWRVLPNSAEHRHECEQAHHDHRDSAGDSLGRDEHGKPGDDDEESRRNVSLKKVILNLSLQKNA